MVFFCNCDFDAPLTALPAAAGAAASTGESGTAEGGSTCAAADELEGCRTAGQYIMQKLGLMWEAGP